MVGEIGYAPAHYIAKVAPDTVCPTDCTAKSVRKALEVFTGTLLPETVKKQQLIEYFPHIKHKKIAVLKRKAIVFSENMGTESVCFPPPPKVPTSIEIQPSPDVEREKQSPTATGSASKCNKIAIALMTMGLILGLVGGLGMSFAYLPWTFSVTVFAVGLSSFILGTVVEAK